MTPEQERKLDELLDETKELRREVALIRATVTLTAEQGITMGKVVADLVTRVTRLEGGEHHQGRAITHSVTNEIGEAVGNAVGESMRVVGPDLARSVASGSILRNVVAGLVIGIAVVAYLVFEKR